MIRDRSHEESPKEPVRARPSPPAQLWRTSYPLIWHWRRVGEDCGKVDWRHMAAWGNAW